MPMGGLSISRGPACKASGLLGQGQGQPCPFCRSRAMLDRFARFGFVLAILTLALRHWRRHRIALDCGASI